MARRPRRLRSVWGRDQSTITRLLVKRLPRKKQGRKAILSSVAVDRLEAKLEAMVQKADGRYEVTVAALKRASRTKASGRTTLQALRARGIYCRRLREKPVLTEEDIQERKAVVENFVKQPYSWRNSALHLIINVKQFRVLPRAGARRYAD